MTTMKTNADSDCRVIPLKGVRGMIADNMRRSLDEAAQLTHHADCDATALFEAKARLADQGVVVSIEDLVAHAVVAVLGRHPGLNGRVEEREIRLSSQVHLSMAMALPNNTLVAPAVFDAGNLSLMDRSAARRELLQRARSGKLSVPEMTGGTFTISNLGLSRVHHFTPIVNLPQIAILGVGETRLRPWVSETGELVVRRIMGLSLSFDHRAIDGAPAADFLGDLCTQIEQG